MHTQPEPVLSRDEAVAIVETRDPHTPVRLAFPYADDEFAEWLLATHTTYPHTLTVDGLVDEIAAAVPAIEANLVTVDCDGLVASWHPATGFTGDPTIVAAARQAATGGYEVPWGRLPEPEVASENGPRGALAALMDHNSGRTRITEWPPALRDWWIRVHEDCGTDHD